MPPATESATKKLEHGRASCAKHAWVDAYESLSRADEASPLAPEDLELLATSAYMLGRDDEYLRCLERAHYSHLDAGEVPRAARCTWWIGLNLLMRGEAAPASGWFARGERLLERDGQECVERGYLLLAAMLGHFAEGDFEAARALAAEAAAIGRALRRSRPGRARRDGRGPRPSRAGANEGGPQARRREHDRGHDRGAVADRGGDPLLQHDRGLSGRVRASPRSGSGPPP